MGRFIYSEDGPQPVYASPRRPRRSYGFFKFLCDCVLTVVTSGLWLIWIFVREMRSR